MAELQKDHRLQTFKEVQVKLVIYPQPCILNITVAFSFDYDCSVEFLCKMLLLLITLLW